MQIISGIARGLRLEVPEGLAVRPTPDRSRKALFDSLGDFDGKVVFDLFAGSGALGLEAASRGADAVYFFESSRKHCANIEDNIEKLRKVGVECPMQVICGDASTPSLLFKYNSPDVVFADPPYAVSARCYKNLVGDKEFCSWIAGGMLVWELPSEQYECESFMECDAAAEKAFRKFGGNKFLILNWPAVF